MHPLAQVCTQQLVHGDNCDADHFEGVLQCLTHLNEYAGVTNLIGACNCVFVCECTRKRWCWTPLTSVIETDFVVRCNTIALGRWTGLVYITQLGECVCVCVVVVLVLRRCVSVCVKCCVVLGCRKASGRVGWHWHS